MTAKSPKQPKPALPPADDDSLFVQPGQLARMAPLVAGQPTVAIELGTDSGPSGVGLLRRIEVADDGLIVGVCLETSDDLSRTIIQSSVGFRIIQGRYAEKEYVRYLKNMTDYVAETIDESEARLTSEAGMSPPEVIARALANVTGGRVMGVHVMDDEDEAPVPLVPRRKTKH